MLRIKSIKKVAFYPAFLISVFIKLKCFWYNNHACFIKVTQMFTFISQDTKELNRYGYLIINYGVL